MRRPGVCFDATGTLIEGTRSVGEVYRAVALEFGVDLPAWRLDDAFRRVLRHAPVRGLAGTTEAERRAGEFDWWAEVIRQTFQATDSTARFDDREAFSRALFDAYRAPGAWRARPGIPEMLARLRATGVPLGVVSNFDHRLPEILEHLDLLGFFETVEIPSREGRRKPEPGVFAALALALGRDLAELVYVGDDPPEVLDAIAAQGLRVVAVDRETDWSDPEDHWLDAAAQPSAATLRTPGTAAPAVAPHPRAQTGTDEKGPRSR